MTSTLVRVTARSHPFPTQPSTTSVVAGCEGYISRIFSFPSFVCFFFLPRRRRSNCINAPGVGVRHGPGSDLANGGPAASTFGSNPNFGSSPEPPIVSSQTTQIFALRPHLTPIWVYTLIDLFKSSSHPPRRNDEPRFCSFSVADVFFFSAEKRTR